MWQSGGDRHDVGRWERLRKSERPLHDSPHCTPFRGWMPDGEFGWGGTAAVTERSRPKVLTVRREHSRRA